MVRYLLVLVLLSLKTVACGDQQESFYPFAKTLDMGSSENPEMKLLELLSPIQKEEMYLSDIMLSVENEWEMHLDFSEVYDYQEEYYRSYITLHQNYLDKAIIRLSYNTTRKDRSSLAFCANWKVYSLTELLARQSTPEAPLYPVFTPPADFHNEMKTWKFILSLLRKPDAYEK